MIGTIWELNRIPFFIIVIKNSEIEVIKKWTNMNVLQYGLSVETSEHFDT